MSLSTRSSSSSQLTTKQAFDRRKSLVFAYHRGFYYLHDNKNKHQTSSFFNSNLLLVQFHPKSGCNQLSGNKKFIKFFSNHLVIQSFEDGHRVLRVVFLFFSHAFSCFFLFITRVAFNFLPFPFFHVLYGLSFLDGCYLFMINKQHMSILTSLDSFSLSLCCTQSNGNVEFVETMLLIDDEVVSFETMNLLTNELFHFRLIHVDEDECCHCRIACSVLSLRWQYD